MKKYIYLLFLIQLLSSCNNSPIYRSIFVPSQIKETISRVLNKEITIDSLFILSENYTAKKNNTKNIHFAKHGNNIKTQILIDNFESKNILSTRYEFGYFANDTRNHLYICTIEYELNNKKNNFQLVFQKAFDDDDYFLIELTKEGANELP